MRSRPAAIFAAALILYGPGVAAAPLLLDLPGGQLGAAVAVLGQQADVGISIADAGLWRRQVRPVKGRMEVAAALRRLGGDDVDVIAVGAGNWRVARRTSQPLPGRRATPPHPEIEPGIETIDPAIVVTASKRDVRLSAFQGSASVLDGRDLAFGGERGTDAILSRLATVTSTHLGAGRNKLFIRGIADSSFTGPTQATVGQYFGDVRLTYNAPDPDLRLYDVAAVEVLEGPQGTLYGAGSLGGIIRVTRNPASLGIAEASASMGISATQHGAPGGDFGGMINLPLAGETAALRLVGYAVSDGGYIDNPLLGRNDVNQVRTIGGRASLRIALAADWTFDIDGTVQHIDGDDSQYADRGGPPLTHQSRFAQGFAARYGLADAVLNGRLGDLHLQSSTGFASQQLSERYDDSLPDGPDRAFTQANHTLLASNETRVWRPMRDGLGWVIGGSLLYNRTRLTRSLGPLRAPLPVAGVTNSITEVTVYGESSVSPLPWLTATGGGRFSYARLSGAAEDVPPALLAKVALDRARVTADRSEHRLLPSLAVSVMPATRLIVFARYSQGFRPGGLTIADDFVRRFRNDRVASGEVGVRLGDPQHGRFDAEVSLDATRWQDIQADFIDGRGLPTTDNIGDGRIHSVAMHAGWRPIAGLAVDIGYSFNDGRVTDPAPRFAAAFAGDRMARIPNVARNAARAGVDYRTALSETLDLRLAGSVQYIGRSRLGIGPVLGAEQGDYIDSSLTMRIGRSGLGLTLGLTNLADTVGNRFALGAPIGSENGGQITPLRPRTIRIGLDTRF